MLQPSTKSFHLIIFAAADYMLTKLDNRQASRKENSERIECTGGAYRNRTDVHGFAIRCITTLPTRPNEGRE